jgi:hypothetical protein
MTVTYQHNADPSMDNPAPLTHDALASAGNALAEASEGRGPLTRDDARTAAPLQIMGSTLSPSPEPFGAGAGVLEVDYADGTTRPFDVGADGAIAPRRYAYAFALVFETNRPLTEEERGEAIDEYTLPASLGATIQYASTPAPIPLNTGNYGEQPAGFGTRHERTPS